MAVGGARSSVLLASPFLSWPIATQIADATRHVPQKRLLTALDVFSVRAGVLNPRALRALHESGFEIATRANLHAKVALVDDSWGLLGSGNLTIAGLGPGESDAASANIELGVILDPSQRTDAHRMFAEWWSNARRVSLEEIAGLEQLPPFPRSARMIVDGGPPVEPITSARIDEILAEAESEALARRYWVKAAYHTSARDPDAWWRGGWISDWRDPRYRERDLVVLYLRAPKRCCPAILEVVEEPREDSAFVEAHSRGPADRKWPWVTRTDCIFDMAIDRAPPPSVFDVDTHGLQNGYRGITREQFARAARAMLSR